MDGFFQFLYSLAPRFSSSILGGVRGPILEPRKRFRVLSFERPPSPFSLCEKLNVVRCSIERQLKISRDMTSEYLVLFHLGSVELSSPMSEITPYRQHHSLRLSYQEIPELSEGHCRPRLVILQMKPGRKSRFYNDVTFWK